MSTVIILTPPPAVVQAVDTALRELPNKMDSRDARAMVLAIPGQESNYQHRRQIITKVFNGKRKLVAEGPAKSLWQAEKGGGMCAGILAHSATAILTRALCERHGVAPTAQGIWDAIEFNDVLAAQCARLLLWTDPHPLPALGDTEAARECYIRVWRPGAYTRGNAQQRAEIEAKWAKYYAAAVKVVS